jgi:RNA-directed DNA polymerase
MPGETLVKTGAPELEWLPLAAGRRVLEIQTRLHRWAAGDPQHRFDDLFNLVTDPAFLMVAWDRVRGNKGSRTAGVDGKTARYIESVQGAGVFLGQLRRQLKERSFRPVPVRERMIPKADGKMRRLGIPTTADRVVQASLKLVLEPIFEADFHRAPTGSAPGAGPMTRSPRRAFWPAARMSGWSRATSRRASTRSPTRP